VVALALTSWTAATAQCPGLGDCCVANGTGGCDDVICCAEVCGEDPFCCEQVWDSLCAAAAQAGCTVCGVGCPGPGGCCEANFSPGCNDAFCCQLVCASDPYCCDTEWDGVCAGTAQTVCAACLLLCPGGGDCCINNGTPGCNDAACCELVCDLDSFCCDGFWDGLCAATAIDLCAVCEVPRPDPGDLDGDGTTGVADLLLLLGAWGGCDSCEACVADLNGDCDVGAADFLILLALWAVGS